VKTAGGMKAEVRGLKGILISAFVVCVLFLTSLASFTGCTRIVPPPVGSCVVALDPVSLEILHRLGIEVAGVPHVDFDKVDAKYGDRDRYIDAGTAMEPDYVAIALLNPSEVIISDATEKAFGNIKSSFEALGIPVKFFDYNGVPELKSSIVKIGEYFNQKTKAMEIVSELEQKERGVLEKVASLEYKPRVMVLFGAPFGTPAQSISIAGSGFYAGSIISYSGAINVIDELQGKQVLLKPDNWAPILNLNPDYIFCTAHGNTAEVWSMYDSCWDTTPWNLISAVQDGNIYYLPESVVGIVAEFDYVSAMQYVLDIFDGKVNPYAGGYKNG